MQLAPRREHPLRRQRAAFPQGGKVPHFAARSGVALAVQVQLYVVVGADAAPVGWAGLPEVAQQIGHGGGSERTSRAERQAARGPYLLLELARDVPIDREMARVVRSRGELIDQQ